MQPYQVVVGYVIRRDLSSLLRRERDADTDGLAFVPTGASAPVWYSAAGPPRAYDSTSPATEEAMIKSHSDSSSASESG